MREDILADFKRSDYQIENFSQFLKNEDFSFTKKAIHIAGTNGKGSVAHYLYSIYRDAGYNVALYTSPFREEINEMMIVNDEPISDAKFLSYLEQYRKQFEKYDLSKFEIETFIAFIYFMECDIDLAIIECGMGGEEDATNIFTPILSIITSVSLEHTEQLGRTTSEIALAKAGIIKDSVPSLVGSLDEEDLKVINDYARRKNSEFHTCGSYVHERLISDGYSFTYAPYSDLEIKSKSLYSIQDASIAIEATKIINHVLPVSETNIRNGLLSMRFALRMDIVCEKPLVIIDGAHNVEATKNLADSIEKVAEGRPIHIIFACFRDKNLEGMLSSLNYMCDDITLTTFPHERARTEDEYFLYLEEYSFVNDYQELIQQKMSDFPDDVILITGSLAFASLAKEIFE
ncbi:MAG: hypothetical protein LUB56_01480 [Coprobacillus sp.]|nr:hypothetical protein [Coprobacillus sp.]